MTAHTTEAEVARDLHTVLEKVWQGVEVIIEQDSRPVAVMKPVVFARNIEEGIKAHREPRNPPAWE
jgi:antitoxin (DNA-binding transcriptional repressor) of toxin-antitoxin stability system